MTTPSSSTRAILEAVLAQMQSALLALDACEAPADIGAHLDLAISRLRDAIDEVPILHG